MTLASTIDKTRKDIEKALGDKSPFLVLAGVGDLAAERVRAARADLAARAETFDAKSLRDEAQARIAALPALAQSLPNKAEDAVTVVVSNALIAYGDLTERGKTFVSRVRGQQATADFVDQAPATVAKAKAASTTARKSASSTSATAKRSAASTAASAKKSAARTKTAGKAATTSATKTTKAAQKAADDSAAKLGD
jgi:hypothetical protein